MEPIDLLREMPTGTAEAYAAGAFLLFLALVTFVGLLYAAYTERAEAKKREAQPEAWRKAA